MSCGALKKKHVIISSSILNKFNDWSAERLSGFVCDVDFGTPLRIKQEELAIYEDVKLQLECFTKIETEWSRRDLSFDLLVKINALVTGQAGEMTKFRSLEYVRDFGGETPTNVGDIPAGISTIEKIMVRLNTRVYDNDSDMFAAILAELFCTIINVHPFEDGNGRTARFVVQLVLLKNGYEYLELPKYRNDDLWRKALDLGTKGDFSAAARFLSKRLEPVKDG